MFRKQDHKFRKWAKLEFGTWQGGLGSEARVWSRNQKIQLTKTEINNELRLRKALQQHESNKFKKLRKSTERNPRTTPLVYEKVPL